MTVNLNIENRAALRGLLTFYTNHPPINACIVVYDITKRYSFMEAEHLVGEFIREARPGTFVALVGNKADLESGREVSFEVSNVAMFI